MQQQQATQKELSRTRERYRTLVESTSDWLWEVDHTGTYTYASPQLESLLGYKPAEVIGRTPFDLMPAAEAQRVSQIFFSQIARDALPIENLVNTNLHKDGHEVVLETSGLPVYDSRGRLRGYRGIDRDISQRFAEDQQRRLAAMVLEHTPEGVMITDSELRIITVNQAFTGTTGYRPEEIVGQQPSVLSSGKHDENFYRDMWQNLLQDGKWQGEIWNRRKSGEVYPEWLNINSIKDDSGKIIYYAAMFSDISSQEHIRKRLHLLAYYDDLTGLPNRELFNDRLNNAIAQARRHHNELGLMFLDIDRFKNINDTLGHKTGDSLLKVVAEKLLHCVRDSDSVSRLGGDEFTIIVNDISSADDVVKIARKVIDTFSLPIKLPNDMELYATTSIGVCIYPVDGDCSETLIKNADTAMYRAKESGRNNYQFYTREMSRHFAERLTLENELRKAVEKNQLCVAYQPQVNLHTGHITGFEALVRWQHKKHGWISPARFIPIAEDTGLIYQIGEQVLQQACQQLKYWHDSYDKDLCMAINISGHQLSKSGIIDYLVGMIDSIGLPHDAIELELTESSLMGHTESVVRVMEQLSKTGIKIAIDDFGTGYSSLSYLKRFAIDKLKIDRSFVQDINLDENGTEIVTAIIAMANNLGLEVIAEGVETRRQIDYLMQHGCHRGQGFYFSEARCADDIGQILATNKAFIID
jgi:diguanylate cyclase (GGDEF)-like protein/PAS domain S-box-containing protein